MVIAGGGLVLLPSPSAVIPFRQPSPLASLILAPLEQEMQSSALIPLSIALSLGLFGCSGDKSGDTKDSTTVGPDTYSVPVDADGDGVTEGDGDCDDNDPDIHPGRAEDCNGVDDNCNSLVDEGYPDTDADGTADCQDVEECDGLDNNGDGVVDEGYADGDGDGVADCVGSEECDGIDNNDNGEIDEGFDADGDGYTQCGDDDTPADCDDSDAAVSPGASEVSGDLSDNDCDGLVDEGDWAEGDFFITEIMNNPYEAPDPEGEWFEIYNASDRTLILNGMIIMSATDGDWHQVESSELLQVDPNDYFIFGREMEPAFNGGVDVAYQYEDVLLQNESDDLMLEMDGIVVDQVTWDDGATFPDPSGASMTLDPASYGVDLNDSGLNWCPSSTRWETGSDYGSPGQDNEYCWPTGVASYDAASTLYTCDTLYLDGSGSYDPDGAALKYDWELVSAPASSALSTSDITKTTSMSPTVIPDVSGNYTFGLTVYNGTTYSPPSYVTVAITTRPYNTDPAPAAGADQSASASSVCASISYGVSYSCDACEDYDFTLDGSGSYDPDGDWVDDPQWTITSGSTYGTLTDDTSWTPTVTISGVAATYGVATAASVTVELSVSDCMGATATDEVIVTYTCTGT